MEFNAKQKKMLVSVKGKTTKSKTISRIKPATFFTKGSDKNLVLKIQGNPDSITPHHTYELWHYGYSYVKISLQTNKVIDWYNTDGKLKVE